LKSGEVLFKPAREGTIEDKGLTTPSLTPYDPSSPQTIVGMLTIAGLLAAAYAAYRSPRVRAGMITVIFFGALVLGIVQLYRMYYTGPEEEDTDIQVELPQPDRLPEELFNDVPELVDLVSLLTTVGMVVLGMVAVWLMWRFRQRLLNRKPPLTIIADEVESALKDLRAGANLKDTVMRCYYDMSRALGKGLGLVRQKGMTPREFEQLLSDSGLPNPSIKQLTRLFERVRYGGFAASDKDKDEAISCLESIVHAVGDQTNRVMI